MTQNWEVCLMHQKAIQMDLVRLEKWADTNLKKFSMGNCQVLHPGRNSPRHQDALGVAGVTSWISVEKAWGVLVGTEFNMS